jgi:hypothetical protein
MFGTDTSSKGWDGVAVLAGAFLAQRDKLVLRAPTPLRNGVIGMAGALPNSQPPTSGWKPLPVM